MTKRNSYDEYREHSPRRGRAPDDRQAHRRQLRDAIVSLELKPGDAISESEIAARFGVSRQPVREAFIQLVRAGPAAHPAAAVDRSGADLDPRRAQRPLRPRGAGGRGRAQGGGRMRAACRPTRSRTCSRADGRVGRQRLPRVPRQGRRLPPADRETVGQRVRLEADRRAEGADGPGALPVAQAGHAGDDPRASRHRRGDPVRQSRPRRGADAQAPAQDRHADPSDPRPEQGVFRGGVREEAVGRGQ